MKFKIGDTVRFLGFATNAATYDLREMTIGKSYVITNIAMRDDNDNIVEYIEVCGNLTARYPIYEGEFEMVVISPLAMLQRRIADAL